MAFADILGMVRKKMETSDTSKAQGVTATFQFELSGDNGGTFQLKVTDGNVELVEGAGDNPNVTILMADNDFVDLMEGKLNATSAFMAGKLKVKGDMSLAMKLQSVIG
ncbi:MAG: SCP2 sterol-binding domain-containing protein [Dethiobacteria bacterium]|jgi:putative sterol carrier protein|nr:SCP2 sterol-binding domain-containing protein [Bacillota bacterium]